jgi:predicted outer membrane repeat protein
VPSRRCAFLGGAVYFDDGVTNVFVISSTFRGNTANTTGGGVGGAITVNTSNSNVYFYTSSFNTNKATADGGAVALWNLNSAVHFDGCSFMGNTAGATGGAVYLGKANGNGIADSTVATNVIRVVNCDLTANAAAQDGGTWQLPTVDIPRPRPHNSSSLPLFQGPCTHTPSTPSC